MKKRFIVGSNAFFKSFDDFKPHDEDILFLYDKLDQINLQVRLHNKNKCIFEWKRLTPDEYIKYHKEHQCGIFIGKFLVPEFVKEIGFTIEHLKQLEFLLDLLDEKHQYEKLIYNYYIENNDFYLTNEQLAEVYKTYKLFKK